MQDKLQPLFKCYAKYNLTYLILGMRNLLMMRILNEILVLNIAYEYKTF